MKDFIKKRLRECLLKEEMILTNYTNFNKELDNDWIVISKDEQNEDYHFLALFTELRPLDNSRIELGYELSYHFQVFDINSNPKTNFLYKREQVAKFLPPNAKGKIMSIVNNMVKDLVDRINPKIIYRQAMEDIDKNSQRYQNITNILIEMGYKLVHQGKNKDNKESWKFVRDGEEMEINENTIEENYILNTEAFLKRSELRMKNQSKLNLK